MITIGSKHLRKRYIGATNVGAVNLAGNKIWPYIISTSIGNWIITLSSSKTTIDSNGETVTLTYSAKRTIIDTWVQYDGSTTNQYKESKIETATPSLITTVGTINGNNLVIPKNENTVARTITVTASYGGFSASITLNQDAAIIINYKYYAVITDAYQVQVGGITKTLPIVNNNGPTNSYHYGTAVFAIADGPSALTASFISKNYDLGVKSGIANTSPIQPTTKGLKEFTLRVLSVGVYHRSQKQMIVPNNVTLIGYDTEAEATANATTHLCTIIDTDYLPYPSKTTLTVDNATAELVSEETSSEAYYAIHDLIFPLITTSAKVNIKTTNERNSNSSKAITRVTLQNVDEYNRFSFVDIYNYSIVETGSSNLRKTTALFTAAPNSGLTINNCAAASVGTYEQYYGSSTKWYVNAADGSQVSLTADNVGTVLYLYEWLWDTSKWIKLGEIKLEQDAVQGFIFKHGVANSLERKLYVGGGGYVQIGEFNSINAKTTENYATAVGFKQISNNNKVYVNQVSSNIGTASIIPAAEEGVVGWTGAVNNTLAHREIIITGINTVNNLNGIWKFIQRGYNEINPRGIRLNNNQIEWILEASGAVGSNVTVNITVKRSSDIYTEQFSITIYAANSGATQVLALDYPDQAIQQIMVELMTYNDTYQSYYLTNDSIELEFDSAYAASLNS